MANHEHIAILRRGVREWNTWRKLHRGVRPSLAKADLRGSDLREINLLGSTLRGVSLEGADLRGANLTGSKLFHANLDRCDLTGANLTGARLQGATMRGARLLGADLSHASLVGVDLSDAEIDGCRVYGLSCWDVELRSARQRNLIVTRPDRPLIAVENVEVAQFVHLLLNNERLGAVIDTIGTLGVLILGRFSAERKPVLDALRERLRSLGLVPMLFDFAKPEQRDFSETVRVLAGMSRFIVADITSPRSSPMELEVVVPDYMIPLVPILEEGEAPFALFEDLQRRYEWVMDVLEYDTIESLMEALPDAVVGPALELSNKLAERRTKTILSRRASDFLR